MLIHIENGKGGRDRYAMLSPRLLEVLRAYWKRGRPGLWLFPGRDPGDHVAVPALQAACRAARRRARIGKPVRRATSLTRNPALLSNSKLELVAFLYKESSANIGGIFK